MNPKLKKLVHSRINEKLENCSLLVRKNELWILDEDKKNWFFYYNERFHLYYNQKNIHEILNLFAFENLTPILKEWFEDLEIGLVNSVLKTNTEHSLLVDRVLKDSNTLTMKNRYGFSYGFVRKFLEIKKSNGKVMIEDFLPVSNCV